MRQNGVGIEKVSTNLRKHKLQVHHQSTGTPGSEALLLFLVLICVAWQGLSMTLEGVDRHVEGTYVCTADNGIGNPASASMSISVSYPPEIITEKVCIERENKSGHGYRNNHDHSAVFRFLISGYKLTKAINTRHYLVTLAAWLPTFKRQHKFYQPHPPTTTSLHCRPLCAPVKGTKWSWCASSTPGHPPMWCGARMNDPLRNLDMWRNKTRATATPSRSMMLLRMTLESMSVRL